MRGNRKASVTLKIVLLTAGVCLFTVSLATWYIYGVAKEVIRQAAVDELTSARESKARQIEDYFHQIRRQVVTLSESDRTHKAMRAFGAAYADLAAGFRPGPADMIRIEAALTARHRRHQSAFAGMAAKDDPRHLAAPLPLSPAGRLLQYHYGFKHGGTEADDPTALEAYETAHRRFNPFWTKVMQRFGFYDVFLVDHRSGIIVYTHAKEVDFATSLEKGPYRDTNLAKAFRAARAADAPGFVRMIDFQLYPPSEYAPAAFIATPIFEKREKIGALILQLSADKINKVMTAGRNWKKEGMGRTGEGFLIGHDLRMRSDSRFLLESPDDYFALMANLRGDTSTLGLIKRHKTTILLQTVATEAAKDLFRGVAGVRHASDYRGKAGLAAYRPIDIPDMDWGIIVKMDQAEMTEPVDNIRRRLLVMLPFLMAAGVGLAVLLSRRILQPIGELLGGIRQLKGGDLSVRVPVKSADEIGTLGNAFNEMADDLQKFQERLRLSSQAVEQNPSAVVITDAQGRVAYVNDAFCRLWHLSPGGAAGQPLFDMPTGGLPPELEKDIRPAVAAGKIWRGEVSRQRPDGAIMWEIATVAPISNDRGKVTQWMFVREDITPEKQTEAALKEARETTRQSEEQLRRILDTANEGFWFIDNNGVTIEINPAMCQILGRKEADVVGRNISDFLGPNQKSALRHQFAFPEQGKESAYQESLVRPDGTQVPCLFNATPFFDENGTPKGAFAMVTDITEQRRAESAIKQSEERLKLALKSGNIGFWDVDYASGKSVYDEKWAQMLGYELKEIEQSRQTWLDAVHPEDKKRVLLVEEEYRKGLRTEYEVEYRILTKKGDEKWFFSRGSAVAWNDAGEAVRMVGTVRDITGRRRAEMTQARRLRSEKAMAAVSRALLGSDTEPETLRGALKQLLTAAQVDRVYVFRNVEDPQKGVCMEHWLEACAPGIDPIRSGDRSVVWPYGKGFGRWQAELAAGRPVMGTVDSLPEAEKEILKHREVVSLLSLPIFVSAQWFGFIGFDDAFLERFWNSSDVTLLGTTAEIIGAFVERQRIQETLQESERRVKTILHAVNTGIIVINPETRVIADVNPVAAQMIGLSQEEIIGKICHRFICPREEHDCPILDHHEEIDNAERFLVTAHGREVPILKTVVPVMLDSKRHLLESFVDLSERKAAEKAMQQNLEELERFNKLTVNREEKMIQLKEEINALLTQSGKTEKYKIVQ